MVQGDVDSGVGGGQMEGEGDWGGGYPQKCTFGAKCGVHGGGESVGVLTEPLMHPALEARVCCHFILVYFLLLLLRR